MQRFWFRLALALGSTVRELKQRMGSDEFAGWFAFYNIEPFGGEPEDIRWSANLAMQAAANRSKKSPKVKQSDYQLVKQMEPDKPKTPKELFNQIKANILGRFSNGIRNNQETSGRPRA